MNEKNEKTTLIRPHGGYRKLRSYQTAELVYDVTVAFCDRFIGKRLRTHDQMVQAARSGVQNIAEGSMASATSKKTELKLTGVARASLEELLLDGTPEGRWRAFDYDELVNRDKASLDIFWLKDESLADSDNLPDPGIIARQIVDDLEAALEQFKLIAEDLGEEN